MEKNMYVVIDERAHDIYMKEFDDEVKAIREADCEWSYLTMNERKNAKIYVMKRDDNAEDDIFKGQLVYTAE